MVNVTEAKLTSAADYYDPPAVQATPRLLTFRSSRIVYYGPHACSNCGAMVCKMGHEWGGNTFTYPDGPIYPNTEWHPHVCDPKVAAHYNTACGVTADDRNATDQALIG